MTNSVENHVETAGNKLHDITMLLRSAEQRSATADEWLKLSRVVRHALSEVKESLCGECAYGDLIPNATRIAGLQQSIHRLEKQSGKRNAAGVEAA